VPFRNDGVPKAVEKEEEGSGILRRISASSDAKACWTRGLPDIQKPSSKARLAFFAGDGEVTGGKRAVK
jgi:hypothetical protein